MDVHLLVYDLSGGMARQMSAQLLGFQLDAVYHTSIEVQGREWVYDGGIINITPGSSHLGKPLERLHLGRTELPIDVIKEYIDSLRPIFTFERYDLFTHNCNNFSHSLAEFMLGTGIPDYIINMPQRVLATPLGRMLMPQFTQASKSGRSQNQGSILGLQDESAPSNNGTVATPSVSTGKVVSVSSQSHLNEILDGAKNSCAIVFFTSATCPPCKTLYPLYDQLAEQHGSKISCLKIDISQMSTRSIASAYSVSATPTFVTYLKGKEENRWSGADPAALRGNVGLLVEMANPLHPHDKLRLPTLQNPRREPVLFKKMPPMQKLMDKMGKATAANAEIQHLKAFLEKRAESGPQDAVLPEMSNLAKRVQECVATLGPETLFPVVELLRCALTDPRVSGFFAEEADTKTLLAVLNAVNQNATCPYSLRLITLHTACNLFSTPLFNTIALEKSSVRNPLTQLLSSSFLDDSHSNTRVAASSLLYNLALADREARDHNSAGGLTDEDKTELVAAVLEAISQEENSVEALQGMLTALGHMVYKSDVHSEVADLLRVMDAEGTILGKRKTFAGERLIQEIGGELIGKGLRKP